MTAKRAYGHPSPGWLAKLKERYSYDPETGIVTWRHDNYVMEAGTAVGSRYTSSNGSVHMKIAGGQAMQNVIWFLVTGFWPYRKRVVPTNGDYTDMRWANLKLVTPKQSTAAKKKHTVPLSPYLGVSWNKREKKWRVWCGATAVGSFDSDVEAAKAYDRTALRLFGTGAMLNFPDEISDPKEV